VLGHVALHEDRRPLGIDPCCDQDLGRLQRLGREVGGIPREGQGVEVDDAIEGVVLVLELDPVAQGAHVVAQVHVTRRLDSREHSRHPPRVRVSGKAPR
jgi:hypothetical protein